VVEITKDNQNQPIPMKNGIPGKLVAQLKIKKFIGVQSVVAFENKLYVLDTRSPLFGAVLDAPRLCL
jgi:hypothetical protein